MALKSRTHLLNLPAELRLAIYEAYLASLSDLDSFDATGLYNVEPAIGAWPQHKTYSFIHTHPLIYKEALPLIISTHPVVFYSEPETRPSNLWTPYPERIQAATLDFGRCKGKVVRKAIERLANLPSLATIKIHFPWKKKIDSHREGFNTGTSVLPVACPSCTFPSLTEIEIVDGEDDRKQRAKLQNDAEIARLEVLDEVGRLLEQDEDELRDLRLVRRVEDYLEPYREVVFRDQLCEMNRRLEEALACRVSQRASGKHSLPWCEYEGAGAEGCSK